MLDFYMVGWQEKWVENDRRNWSVRFLYGRFEKKMIGRDYLFDFYLVVREEKWKEEKLNLDFYFWLFEKKKNRRKMIGTNFL